MATTKETKKETATATVVASSSKDPTKWPRIYVGPSMSKGYFKSNMVFANGFSAVAKELIEKMPLLKQLIVPTAEYVIAKQQIATKGTMLNTVFNKVAEQLKENANV